MKVSCFTFIRNGVLLGYPFIESICSALPLCDEFIIVVGNSDDDTLNRIKNINSNKIKIIETYWNEGMHDRGFVYAQQKMIAQYNCTGDWAFYLEGDEILHEQDLTKIKSAMEQHLKTYEIEALVFDYHHFFGSQEWEAISPAWYSRECRIIRNTIRSWAPDGQYWVVMNENRKGRHPNAALINAKIYHYGHVRSIDAMREKNQRVGKYWGDSHPLFKGYQIDPLGLKKFIGTHPKIINKWLEIEAEKNYMPNNFYVPNKREIKHRIVMKLERFLNISLRKKHYQIISKE